jgi:hypothetical protein
MPNKAGRKELFSDKIAVILTLHKLGYAASQIGREEGLTETDNYLPDPTRSKHQNDPFIKAIQTGKPPRLGTHAEQRLVMHSS